MPHKSKNLYSLPFSSSVVTNTWHKSPAHTGPFVTALDFEMAAGSDVLAALDGEVITVVDHNTKYGPSPKYANSVNYISLKHDNGEYSQYLHLESGSAAVKKDDIVKKGQLIARTGLSGWMNAPHLHWFVLKYDDSPETFSGLIPQMDDVGSVILSRAK